MALGSLEASGVLPLTGVDATVIPVQPQEDNIDLYTFNGIMLAKAMAAEVMDEGACEEYRVYAAHTFPYAQRNTFDFIHDAVEGTGGFADGSYLEPHRRELDRADTQTRLTGMPTIKYLLRKRISDYDNFARIVCDTHFGYVVQSADTIKRSDNTPPELQSWWKNVDHQGTSIVEFHEQPARQARMYGAAVVCVDRPRRSLPSLREDQDPRNAPYAYLIPTKYVVNWKFDPEDGRLMAIAWLEPTGDGDADDPMNLRVWTEDVWAVFAPFVNPVDGSTRYDLFDWDVNKLGEVPVAVLYNERPLPKKLFAHTEMVHVARMAKTVYNIDSERREIERNTAFAMLAVPTDSPGDIGKLALSTEGALGYDPRGTSAKPGYVEANLVSLDKLLASKTEKKESAYALAQLGVISGHIQTKSGFHSQAEFDKTNRRIGRFAKAIESYETRLSYLVLRWLGWNRVDAAKAFSISYPQTFGLYDMQLVIAQTSELLTLGLGQDNNEQFVRDLITSRYPRLDEATVNRLAKAGAQAIQDQLDAGAASPGNNALETKQKNAVSAQDTRLARSGLSGRPTPEETI